MKSKYTRIARNEDLRETVSHGSEEYPFSYYYECIWDFDLHCIDWHWHPEVEFVYLKKGTMTAMAGTDRFEVQEGCAVFINSQIIHSFRALNSDAVIPNIVFSPEILAAEGTLIWQKYILPILNASAPWQLFSPDVIWQRKIIEMLNQIFADQSDYPDEMKTCRDLLELWDILYHNTELYHENRIAWNIDPFGQDMNGSDRGIGDFRQGIDDLSSSMSHTGRNIDNPLRNRISTNTSDTINQEKSSAKNLRSKYKGHSVSHQAQIQVVMQYIQSHYQEPLSLDDIASSVHISKSSVLKLFASYLQVSPVAYLIRCRLRHAAAMLKNTEETLNVIASRTGFNDTAYFCRKFKELYQVTPTEYRKLKRAGGILQ